MKVIWATAALLLVAGCSSGQSAATTAHDAALSKSDYYSLVRENVPRFATRSDHQLDVLGRSLCVVLKDDSWLVVIKNLTTAGLSGRDAGEITGYATATFCPELKTKLPTT